MFTGPEEWQAVSDQHAVTYPEEGRDTDSIRRKFANLHRKQIPTGDPSMPEEVKIAKRIKHKIGNKVNIGDAEELYNVEGNRFESFDDDAAPPPPPEAPAPPAVPPPIVAPAAPPIAATAAAQPAAAAANASGKLSIVA